MKLLILGGTRFIGRVLAEQAHQRGHDVLIFNRGRTGVDPEGAEVVRGDREVPADVEHLREGRTWDAVVDTSGYVPGVVLSNARALVEHAGRYIFLSTISVYPDWPQHGVSETSPLPEHSIDAGGTAEDEADWSAAQYGNYKAGCEQAVRTVFGEHSLILRSSVVLGPGENVGRLTWWLRRAARGGRMLAPGDPQRPMQPIDVRDLASFTLTCLEQSTGGTLNVAAPRDHTTYGQFVDSCIRVTESDAEPVWVDDDFLLEHGVTQWTELPLWRTYPGTWDMATDTAQAAGLVCRPMPETVRDTWRWLQQESRPSGYARESHHGLAADKEQRLLTLWDQTYAPP